MKTKRWVARFQAPLDAIARALAISLVLVALSACGGAGSPGPGGGNPGGLGPTSPPGPTSTPGPTPTPPAGVAAIGGCPVFPPDNAWNEDISGLPVDANSANYMAHMHAGTTNLHPDFGSNPTYGIPYVTVHGNTQPFVPITFTEFPAESDPGPYPVPSNAPVEGGAGAAGDRHVLVVDVDHCVDYEMYHAQYVGPGWDAGSGAVWHFNSNALRPLHWTSADAAGLPIVAGVARYDETVQIGAIYHALRFTVNTTQRAFILPATHYASASTDPNDPPMGLRVRLKASYDISHFTGASLVILTALKKYGMMIADNGSDWFISGSTDIRWDDNDLDQLKTVPASAFEVVHTGTPQT
jgi:hypothetical protein